jgi:hypothetical protein
MMRPHSIDGLGCRLEHIGFVVEDRALAAANFRRNVQRRTVSRRPTRGFGEVTFLGQPCTWEHSPAFAAWGDIQIETRSPQPRKTGMAGRPW